MKNELHRSDCPTLKAVVNSRQALISGSIHRDRSFIFYSQTVATTFKSITTAGITSYASTAIIQRSSLSTNITTASTTSAATTQVSTTTTIGNGGISATIANGNNSSSTTIANGNNSSSTAIANGNNSISATIANGNSSSSTTTISNSNSTSATTFASFSNANTTTTAGTARDIYNCLSEDYIGTYCNISSDACAMSKPCRNAATCLPNKTLPYGYRCNCKTGYSGDNCEYDERACKENTCW